MERTTAGTRKWRLVVLGTALAGLVGALALGRHVAGERRTPDDLGASPPMELAAGSARLAPSDRGESIAPRAFDSVRSPSRASPDHAAFGVGEDDPLELVSASERVSHYRDDLEGALDQLEQPTTVGADRERLRLRAATSLTALRAELGQSPQGRRELQDHASRLRDTAHL